MNVKAFLFAATGLLVVGIMTAMWMGRDTTPSADEQMAKWRSECNAIMNDIKGGDASARSRLTPEILQNCSRAHVFAPLEPSMTGVEPSTASSVPIAPGTSISGSPDATPAAQSTKSGTTTGASRVQNIPGSVRVQKTSGGGPLVDGIGVAETVAPRPTVPASDAATQQAIHEVLTGPRVYDPDPPKVILPSAVAPPHPGNDLTNATVALPG